MTRNCWRTMACLLCASLGGIVAWAEDKPHQPAGVPRPTTCHGQSPEPIMPVACHEPPSLVVPPPAPSPVIVPDADAVKMSAPPPMDVPPPPPLPMAAPIAYEPPPVMVPQAPAAPPAPYMPPPPAMEVPPAPVTQVSPPPIHDLSPAPITPPPAAVVVPPPSPAAPVMPISEPVAQEHGTARKANPEPAPAMPISEPVAQKAIPAPPMPVKAVMHETTTETKSMPAVSAPAPLAPATAPVQFPWKLSLEIVAGLNQFEIRRGEELLLRIQCERLDLQSPVGGLHCLGKVVVQGPTMEARCDRLMIAWTSGQVALEGHVRVTCVNNGIKQEIGSESLCFRLPGQANAIEFSSREVSAQLYVPRNKLE